MYTHVAIIQQLADDDWGHMGGWDGGWMWLWGSLMMASWVAIIATAIWLLTRSRYGGGRSDRSRAREILDERYASGDLTTEEYRDRLHHLR